jgi:hypothetical protein
MTPPELVIAGVAFLSGAAVATFIMLVVGIRRGDRRSADLRSTPLDAFTRATLRASTWPDNPVVHGDHHAHEPQFPRR